MDSGAPWKKGLRHGPVWEWSSLTYTEALAYLYSFADYERGVAITTGPAQFNLERTVALLEVLGNPQRRFASVLVAGTKGKGSTAAMIQSILRAAGLVVGLYSQPHLHTYRERVRVGDRLIAPDELAAQLCAMRGAVEETHRRLPELGHLTTYEIGTALAFQHFAREAVDLAVLEVGLGGRLDATNVVHPLVSVITSISLDHTRILGDTIPLIAREKAGIIKEGGVVVAAPQVPEAQEVIEGVAAAKRARLVVADWGRIRLEGQGEPAGAGERGTYRFALRGELATYDGLEAGLRGAHQLVNAAAAVMAVEELARQGYSVGPAQVRQGLSGVRWPGRLEVLGHSPLIVADGAHNADSAARLREALHDCFEFRRLLLVLGTSIDKDIPGMARELGPCADSVFICRSQHPRAADPAVLAEALAPYGVRLSICGSVGHALSAARAASGPADAILATGSLFVVAEAREAMGVAVKED